MQGENSMSRNSTGEAILHGYNQRFTLRMMVVMNVLQGLA